MAKQSGTVFFEGTIDDLTFYKMNGQYYVRRKSSLTKKRFKKDPQFENSRRNAASFGRASKLASQVYRKLQKEKKHHGLFGDITAMAIRFLRKGMIEAQVIIQLQKFWLPVAKPQPPSDQQLGKEEWLRSDWEICQKGYLHHYPVGLVSFNGKEAGSIRTT